MMDVQNSKRCKGLADTGANFSQLEKTSLPLGGGGGGLLKSSLLPLVRES